MVFKNRYLINHLVLIHLCSTHVPASDSEAVPEMVRQINQLYDNTNFVPVHFCHQDIDREEQEALMAASGLGIFLGPHSSTLIASKKFIVSQNDRRASLILLQDLSLKISNGAIAAVEGSSDITALVTALHGALTMCPIDAEKRYAQSFKFVLENDTIACAHRFIQAFVGDKTPYLYPTVD